MGQKVNPKGLRIGVIKDLDAKWYSDKNDDQICIRISKNIIRNRKQMQDLSTG